MKERGAVPVSNAAVGGRIGLLMDDIELVADLWMRCAQCRFQTDLPVDRCPECGAENSSSESYSEVLPISAPVVLPPEEQWRLQPCRIAIRWSSSPDMSVLLVLKRAAGFTCSGREILERVRASPVLTSAPMTYGEALEWMRAHARSLGPGSAEIEVQSLQGDWGKSPGSS